MAVDSKGPRRVLISLALLCFERVYCAVPNPGNPDSKGWQDRDFEFTLPIHPRDEECFYENIDANVPVKVDVWVMRGGLYDIGLTVTDPGDVVLFNDVIFTNEDAKNSDGTVVYPGYKFVTAVDGVYQFCLDNTMSRFTPKLVMFDVHLGHAPGVAVASVKANRPSTPVTPDDSAALQEKIDALSEQAELLKKEQQYFRLREARHRDTAESTNERELWASVLEGCLVVVVSLMQTLLVTTWFDGKPNVGGGSLV